MQSFSVTYNFYTSGLVAEGKIIYFFSSISLVVNKLVLGNIFVIYSACLPVLLTGMLCPGENAMCDSQVQCTSPHN